MDRVEPARIAIVGAGPRGVGVLERIAANAAELAGGHTLEIHLVDPYPPGGGKVWRFDQSALLRLNSMASDITMFTDDTVTCAGPIAPGPSMAEWARLVDLDELPTAELRAEARQVTPITFPTRRLGGEYLGWAYRNALSRLPTGTTVVVHTASAVDVTDDVTNDVSEPVQLVHLDNGEPPLRVDAVVLTLGHLDTDATGESAALADHAARHELAYLPPAYGTEADLSGFEPGRDVIVRGFGLGFVDLLVLLTEGRGGRYHDRGDGRLRYEPSGNEPRFHIGSRRGVPYRAKLTYDLLAPRPAYPRFFHRESITALIAEHDIVDFRLHVWPLIAKEISWAYYHELALAHPARVAVTWADFEQRIEFAEWGIPGWDAMVADCVPNVEDRLDFGALDRPLDGLWFDDAEALQDHLRAHIRADLDRRADDGFSADLGAFDAFLAVFAQLPYVLGSPKLSPKSRVQDFDDWWFGFFSYYASGPPPRRMEELLALSEAGIVRFLGSDTWVRPDDEEGTFVAGSASTGCTVSATALMDARLPGPSVQATRSALVRAMAERGELSELILVEADGSQIATGQIRVHASDQRVVERTGVTHPRRFALGQHSTSRAPAFARPRTNALAFRHNDLCARALLTAVCAPDHQGADR